MNVQSVTANLNEIALRIAHLVEERSEAAGVTANAARQISEISEAARKLG